MGLGDNVGMQFHRQRALRTSGFGQILESLNFRDRLIRTPSQTHFGPFFDLEQKRYILFEIYLESA
jgi:hypothetical protein